MLTFLYLASKHGFEAIAYEDQAAGVMTKNERGRSWVSSVVLRPRITYRGERMPSPEQERQLHHDAHDQCFIANSVKTAIKVEPR